MYTNVFLIVWILALILLTYCWHIGIWRTLCNRKSFCNQLFLGDMLSSGMVWYVWPTGPTAICYVCQHWPTPHNAAECCRGHVSACAFRSSCTKLSGWRRRVWWTMFDEGGGRCHMLFLESTLLSLCIMHGTNIVNCLDAPLWRKCMCTKTTHVWTPVALLHNGGIEQATGSCNMPLRLVPDNIPAPPHLQVFAAAAAHDALWARKRR